MTKNSQLLLYLNYPYVITRRDYQSATCIISMSLSRWTISFEHHDILSWHLFSLLSRIIIQIFDCVVPNMKYFLSSRTELSWRIIVLRWLISLCSKEGRSLSKQCPSLCANHIPRKFLFVFIVHHIKWLSIVSFSEIFRLLTFFLTHINYVSVAHAYISLNQEVAW